MAFSANNTSVVESSKMSHNKGGGGGRFCFFLKRKSFKHKSWLGLVELEIGGEAARSVC